MAYYAMIVNQKVHSNAIAVANGNLIPMTTTAFVFVMTAL
jgi:hypothetical protein